MAVLAVVKDLDGARVAPRRYGIGAHALRPAAGEAERGREQDDARDFGMACGIERGEIATHTAADQGHGAAGGLPFDHSKLAGDGEVFEIAGGEVGDFDVGAGGPQTRGEEAGFAGGGRRGEAVKVEDGNHFLTGAAGRRCVEFGELDLGIGAEQLEGLVAVEVFGDQASRPPGGGERRTRG